MIMITGTRMFDSLMIKRNFCMAYQMENFIFDALMSLRLKLPAIPLHQFFSFFKFLWSNLKYVLLFKYGWNNHRPPILLVQDRRLMSHRDEALEWSVLITWKRRGVALAESRDSSICVCKRQTTTSCILQHLQISNISGK